MHIVNDNITLEKEIKISPTGFAFSQCLIKSQGNVHLGKGHR